MSTPLQIIPAELTHIPAIQAIYAEHVLHGSASFEVEPPSLAEMQQRYQTIRAKGLPYLVALEGDKVLGYCYLTPYRPRYAYRFTLEDSLYLSPESQGKGIGRQLLTLALQQAEQLGYRQIVACIADTGNPASPGLHRALGFVDAGVLKSVGFKHGRWLDTLLMQKTLVAVDSPVIEPQQG